MAAKPSIKHPYAATEHRVIDSPAYADLSYAARSLLVLITRQLTKDNNGHLQATLTYMERYGLSKNTLTRSIRELISHGFIYRSKSGGYNQGAAQYAVTWLSVTNKAGIFMQGFQPCAWRDWLPVEKKCCTPKLGTCKPKNGERTLPTAPKIELSPPPIIEHNELCHVGCINADVQEVTESTNADSESDYIRERETDLTGGYWEDGEFIKLPAKKKQTSPKVESMEKAIERLKRSNSNVKVA